METIRSRTGLFYCESGNQLKGLLSPARLGMMQNLAHRVWLRVESQVLATVILRGWLRDSTSDTILSHAQHPRCDPIHRSACLFSALGVRQYLASNPSLLCTE